jgi:hypothetical protein
VALLPAVLGASLSHRYSLAGRRSIADVERANHIEHFADTPPTGGTAIDAAGNIYVSDTDRKRAIKITPIVSTLIQDPRLLWVDAMWIDDAGESLDARGAVEPHGTISRRDFQGRIPRARVQTADRPDAAARRSSLKVSFARWALKRFLRTRSARRCGLFRSEMD